MSPAEIAAESRRSQGLPDRIVDPAAVRRVAQLVKAATEAGGAR